MRANEVDFDESAEHSRLHGPLEVVSRNHLRAHEIVLSARVIQKT